LGAFFDRRLHPGPRRSRLTRNRNRQGKREEIVRGEAARLETLVTIMVWALKSQNEDQPDCSLSRLPLPVCGRGFVLLCCCRRQPGGRDWTTSSFAGSRYGVAVVDLTPVPGRRRDKGDGLETKQDTHQAKRVSQRSGKLALSGNGRHTCRKHQTTHPWGQAPSPAEAFLFRACFAAHSAHNHPGRQGQGQNCPPLV